MINGCSFPDFLRIATNPSEPGMHMSHSRNGLDVLYDIMNGVCEGRTLEDVANSLNFKVEEATAMLAVAWLDVQRYLEYKESIDD